MLPIPNCLSRTNHDALPRFVTVSNYELVTERVSLGQALPDRGFASLTLPPRGPP